MFRDISAPYHALESWFYDSAVAPAIAEMIHERSSLLQPVFEALPADGRLLDVGCGGGQIAIDLAKKNPGWRITGIDRSPEQVRRAEKRARSLPGQLHFATCSALALPFKDDVFNGAISICSIKHWPDTVRGLEECLRVLRPGGSLVVMEVDPDYSRDDGRAFVARQHLPFFLKPAAMIGFTWKVAARSLHMKETASLIAALPVSALRAAPVPGMPLWVIRAIKKARPCT